MKTSHQLKYAKGEEVCFYSFDGGGASVMYSPEAGFFIKSIIWQRRAGKVWETMDVDYDACEIHQPGESIHQKDKYRTLETFRPISRDQAIRILLNGYEDHGGMMTAISNALDAAGVEPLEQCHSQ